MVFELNLNCVTTVQPKNTRSIVSTVMGVYPGGTPRKIGWGVRPASQNPCPIYDQNLRYLLPFL